MAKAQMCFRANRHREIPLSTAKQHNVNIRGKKRNIPNFKYSHFVDDKVLECLVESDGNILTEIVRLYVRHNQNLISQ
jgi:hypothetical protein